MTSKCQQCGENLRDKARFCVGCGAAVPRQAAEPAGQPPPPPPANPPYPAPPAQLPPEAQQYRATTRPGLSQGTKIAAAAGICALVIGAVIVASTTVGTNSPAPGGSGGSGSLADSATTPPTRTTETVANPTTESASAAPADSRSLLQRQVDQDKPEVDQLVGSWLPQLSAKKPGTVANGITYDYDAIWADFVNNRQQHPEALLLWSGDYASFKYPDFWITVEPRQFGDGTSANAWCDSYGINKDDCYAKRLMHTGGYAGNTLLRK